ncbi:MAG: hypothetical protein DRP13_02215 [Candidatus Aenigmatarchaeota archaeon]|nr:MAG: hypothetical protein DRP13_02215 [Candidatus Aenigmarchaeota archaeon]RLJ08794.1 MAG: hypothetical protein DRP16_00685 [Candidatus Aenigmarchaeota archaeon]
MPLLLLFGIFDLIAGVAGMIVPFISAQGNTFILAIGVLAIIKGLYSYLAGALAGFYFDILGLLDLITGILLVLSFYNLVFGWMFYFGLILTLKGVYTIVIFLVS